MSGENKNVLKGKEFTDKWNELSNEQKVNALYPRLELMLAMIRGAHDFFIQNKVNCSEFEKGMKILNMDIKKVIK